MSAADIFKTKLEPGTWARYEVELQVQSTLAGGIPSDPDTIRGWIKARLDLNDADLNEVAQETYRELLDKNDGEEPSIDELAAEIAKQSSGGNTFKRADGRLVYEGRCMKAALKEASNICYPGTDWPGRDKAKLRKGLMNASAERVFVPEHYIDLGVTEPSLTVQEIKHVRTPQGPRSAIGIVDLVEKPLLQFHVEVLDDFIPPEAWARIWSCVERNGIGADRGHGHGVCELLRWERVPAK